MMDADTEVEGVVSEEPGLGLEKACRMCCSWTSLRPPGAESRVLAFVAVLEAGGGDVAQGGVGQRGPVLHELRQAPEGQGCASAA